MLNQPNSYPRRVAAFTLTIMAMMVLCGIRIYSSTRLGPTEFEERRRAYLEHLRSSSGMSGDILDRSGRKLALDLRRADGRRDRIYPLAEAASHVTGMITRYSPPLGIERWRVHGDIPNASFYDVWLGDPVFSLGRTPDVKLTIDSGLQRECFDALSREKCPGAILMMSFDGEILSMVSTPTWDPNLAVSPGNGEYRRSLDEHVLRNRALAPIAPASCIKPILFLLSKKRGGWPDDFICDGVDVVAGQRIKCHATHGRIDWKSAIIHSCDPRSAALAVDDFTSLELNDAAKKLGFATTLVKGIGRVRGTPPDPSASAGKRAYVGIGNAIEVAPLSLVRAYIAIANNGVAPEPSLIAGKAQTTERLFSQADADSMAGVLRQVVKEGTAVGARRWPIIGKTGTNRLHADPKEEQGGIFVWADPGARIAGIVVLEGTPGQPRRSRDAVKVVDKMYRDFVSSLPPARQP